VVNDCGSSGFRNVLHQGPSLGGGRFGAARYRYATRLINQPASAAVQGRFLMAFNASTSPSFGDPAANSEIVLLSSNDGGNSWEPPVKVAAATAADLQHVHPALSVEDDDSAVVAYYVQQVDTKLRTDMTRLHFHHNKWTVGLTTRLSTEAFDLAPSNNPVPSPSTPYATTHYDRTVAACYDLGEYASVMSREDRTLAAWGDNRRSWTGPPDSIVPGTHQQADVFFRRFGDESMEASR
jgi:hypothetical protein